MVDRVAFGFVLAAMLAGCSGGSAQGVGVGVVLSASAPAKPISSVPTTQTSAGQNTGGATFGSAGGSVALTARLEGKPQSTAMVGKTYQFQPVLSDASGTAPSYSIVNCPAWASFNTATGELTGSPDVSDVGTNADIRISVTVGEMSASLAPFSISVVQTTSGSVALSWVPPTANTDGSAISALAGYRIYYGLADRPLTQSLEIENSTIDTYVVENLPPGDWVFVVKAYTVSNVESPASNMVSKSVY